MEAVKVIASNTVDEKLEETQEKKERELEDAMGTDESRMAKMSISQLMRLFGPVQADADGIELIMLDEQPSEQGHDPRTIDPPVDSSMIGKTAPRMNPSIEAVDD